MRTVIKGKIVENTYSVDSKTKMIKDEDGNDVEVFTDQPCMNMKRDVVETPDILSYEGEPHYNSNPNCFVSFANYLNISENEEVLVNKAIFRADLNEYHLFTDKVVEERDIGKEVAELKLEDKLAQFNKEMIESNDQMNSYCKLHKLNPAETDAIELFKVVFPDKEYEIVDGVMKVHEEEKKDLQISTYLSPGSWENEYATIWASSSIK